MSIPLSGSVGAGGDNNTDDVKKGIANAKLMAKLYWNKRMKK